MTFRSDLRTAAAILISAAAIVALTASGETNTDSGGNEIKLKQSDKSSSSDSKSDEPSYTKSQENAIEAAKQYLNSQAFSKQGLIEQLSSSAGSGYPRKDAVFAVKH